MQMTAIMVAKSGIAADRKIAMITMVTAATDSFKIFLLPLGRRFLERRL